MRPLLLIAALLTAPALHAQKVTLTPFPADGSFRSEQVADMTMTVRFETADSALADEVEAATQEMRMRQAVDTAFDVASDASGISFRVRFERVRLAMDGAGEEVEFDTDEPSDQLEAAAPGLSDLTSSTFFFRMQEDSLRLLDVRGDEAADSASVAEALSGMVVAGMGQQFFDQILSTSRTYLPLDAVGVGDQWEVSTVIPVSGTMPMAVAGMQTVQAVEGTRVAFHGPITLRGEALMPGLPTAIQMTGEGTIRVTYDAATGEERAQSDIVLRGRLEGPSDLVMHMESVVQHVHALVRE